MHFGCLKPPAFVLSHFNHVQLFATLWPVARQASLFMEFSRQEYWSGLPCLLQGDLPDPGIKPKPLVSLTFADRFLTTSTTWEATLSHPVQFSRSVMSDSLRPHGLQHIRRPHPLPTPGVYSNSCSSSQWGHPTISSSVVPFSSCPQSFPTSGSFQMSQFSSGGQSIRVSALALVLPINIHNWFPLGWTGWISLQSRDS